MITKYKIYSTKLNISENRIFKNNDIKFETQSCWVIFGDKNQVIKVLQKFPKEDKEILKEIIRILYSLKKFIGSYIFCENDGGIKSYQYWAYANENEISNILKIIKDEDFDFKGELKIENDELVLNPFSINLLLDINKYNL